MGRFSLFFITILTCFTLSVHGRSVVITSGSINLAGNGLVNSVGQPSQIMTSFNLVGRDFSLVTEPQPLFHGNLLLGYFSYGLEAGDHFSIDDLNFPFGTFEAKFATVTSRGNNYTKTVHTAQNAILFHFSRNDSMISLLPPYSATVPFTMHGSILLKCHELAPAPCTGMIQRMRVHGRGTLKISYSRWTPADGQWAWLYVKTLKFEFSE